MNHRPRIAVASEPPVIVQVWHDAWHEALAPHLPHPLVRMRTPDEFHARLKQIGDGIRVIGPQGLPFGLCAIKGDEVYQLYLAPAARGTGAADLLLADAETRLAAAGISVAKLYCVVENDRARRFYRRCGWCEKGVHSTALDTTEGPFFVETVAFEKPLRIGPEKISADRSRPARIVTSD